MKTYQADNLEDIARLFDAKAKADREAALRATRLNYKRSLEARASTWELAAAIVRDTDLKAPE